MQPKGIMATDGFCHPDAADAYVPRRSRRLTASLILQLVVNGGDEDQKNLRGSVGYDPLQRLRKESAGPDAKRAKIAIEQGKAKLNAAKECAAVATSDYRQQENIDLLTMCAYGRSPIGHLRVDSTAAAVTAPTKAPLAALR